MVLFFTPFYPKNGCFQGTKRSKKGVFFKKPKKKGFALYRNVLLLRFFEKVAILFVNFLCGQPLYPAGNPLHSRGSLDPCRGSLDLRQNTKMEMGQKGVFWALLHFKGEILCKGEHPVSLGSLVFARESTGKSKNASCQKVIFQKILELIRESRQKKSEKGYSLVFFAYFFSKKL